MEVSVGSEVSHEQYGRGIVVTVGDKKVTVRFHDKKIRVFVREICHRFLVATPLENDIYEVNGLFISRKKTMGLLAEFLRIAEKDGIEKIRPKIERAFFGDGGDDREMRDVKKQLKRWVDTNSSHLFGLAIRDANRLYNYLFIKGENNGQA